MPHRHPEDENIVVVKGSWKEREKFIGFHGSLQIARQLDEIAKAEDRPVASILRRIVGDYLISEEEKKKRASQYTREAGKEREPPEREQLMP